MQGRSTVVHRIFIWASWLICALAAVQASAQLPTGTILGVVKDSSGAAVAGASITAKNLETGQTRTSVAGDDGSYRLDAVPVGGYEMRVEHPGFQTDVHTGLTLTVAQEAVVNFALQVGSVSQTVEVTAEAPLVDTTTSELGGLVNEQRVHDLPLNGRNYTNLTLMQPGISQDSSVSSGGSVVGIWYSSNGAPLRSNNYMLDGALMQTQNGGSAASMSGTTLGLEGIREYRVITDTFSAEYGMTMGSQTVIVSKGGTNNFHGSAFEYVRNSVFDARNFFDYGYLTGGPRLPHFARNNFGGSFGGPIKKDKTFFFATYEGLRERTGETIVSNVPGAGCHGAANAVITSAACPQLSSTPSVTIAPVIAPLLTLYPTPNLPNNEYTFPFAQPNTENYGQIRIDQTFSSKDTMFGRYTIDNDQQVADLPYPQFVNQRFSRYQFATLSETHIFSPMLLNTVRLSFSRTAQEKLSPTNLIGPQYSFVPGMEIPQIMIGGVSTFGPYFGAPGYNPQNILTLSDDVYYTHGRHSLKFGTLLNNFRAFMLNSTNLAGGITFASVGTFLAGEPTNYVAATPGSITYRTFDYYTLGFYAQDDIRVTPRLTINAGLRYEPTTQVKDVNGDSSALINPLTDAAFTVGPIFKNPSLHNISPRIGLAWDVRGNGKTSVRAGFAELYDVGDLGSALLALVQAEPPFSSVSTVTGSSTVPIPFVFPASAVGKGGDYSFEYHLQQPHLISEHLTVEQEFPFAMVLSVSYSGSRGIHLIQNLEGNPNVPQFINGLPFWSATAPRENPNWGNLNLLQSNGDSSYNSLQVSLVKRLTQGLEFQSSYTWSKLLDDIEAQGTSESTSNSTYGTDPFDHRMDRGPATFNVPQNWVFNLIYSAPSPKLQNRFLEKFAGGWGLSGIFTVHSGLPFTPAEQTERARSGVDGGGSGIDRPDWNPNFTGPVIVGSPNEYYNPNAFILQPVGTLGNVSRNPLEGPGFEELDFSVRKDTKLGFLGEAGGLQFRADFFNIFNRANFAEPGLTVFAAKLTDTTEAPLSSAGVITSTVASSRQIQLSLRLSF